MPGTPEGPRYVEGRLHPGAGTVPNSRSTAVTFPSVGLRAPLPHVLGDGFDHLGVSTPASDLRTLAPGLALDAPLTPPQPRQLRPPGPEGAPGRAYSTPVLQTVPGADLGLAPGL
jgi:hypothetical protein